MKIDVLVLVFIDVITVSRCKDILIKKKKKYKNTHNTYQPFFL